MGLSSGQNQSEPAADNYSFYINKDFAQFFHSIYNPFTEIHLHGYFQDRHQQDTILLRLTTEYIQGIYNKRNPEELIEIINEILKIDSISIAFWFNLGEQFFSLHQFDQAIKAYEKNLDLTGKMARKPTILLYEHLGYCYHHYSKYNEEFTLYDCGLEEYPGHPSLIGRKAVCVYSMGKTKKMNILIDQYITILKNKEISESDILYSLGILFLESDNLKAENYFRDALKLNPDNVTKKGALAHILVFYKVSTRSIQEAMILLEDVLQKESLNPKFLHLQGLVYFRQERYVEAQEYLEKASNLYPEYNHPLQLQINQVNEILKNRFK